MHDLDTGENLNFSCHRWLARDEDDQEITRELAVKRPGESILPCKLTLYRSCNMQKIEGFANSKDLDQPVHLHRLITAFDLCTLLI